jgi:hypothetical protein
MYEDKTNNEILAEALIQIIENQIEIKGHLGVVKDTGYYGDCYNDRRIIDYLRTIK